MVYEIYSMVRVKIRCHYNIKYFIIFPHDYVDSQQFNTKCTLRLIHEMIRKSG